MWASKQSERQQITASTQSRSVDLDRRSTKVLISIALTASWGPTTEEGRSDHRRTLCLREMQLNPA